jgi:hypothetical protein
VRNWFIDQRHMANRSPEGGDKPGTQGFSDFTVLREQKGVGPRVQKPVEEAGKKQPKPEYFQERIEELRKILPELTTQQIIRRLKLEDERRDDERRGRRRGFSF